MIKKFLTYGLAFLLACTASLPPLVYAQENKEYLVKAAFIYNFVKFVEWPGDKEINSQSHIDICVAGDGGMNHAGQVFKAASTSKLSISLVHENDWHRAASHCHVLFISDSESGKLSEMLDGLKDKPVLTVSDMDNFAENGGMIGFVTSDNKIKLEINTGPVKAAGMRINAQLLEIASKVMNR